MLHRHSRNDIYSPFLRSNPLIQGIHHQAQNDSLQTPTNRLNSSHPHDLNQNQTQRTTHWQNDLQSISLNKNHNSIDKISQQTHSYKLNRIPSQTKQYQPYQNSSQSSNNSDKLKQIHSRNQSIQSSESEYDNYSQNKIRVLAINNQRNPYRKEETQNESRITNRPKSGHLVSLGNPISFKPSPSMLTCNRDAKNSSLNQEQQSVHTNNNKQNSQPNSAYGSHSGYQSHQSLNEATVDKSHQNKQKDSLVIEKKPKTQDPLCYRNTEFIPKNKFMKSGSQLLLPAVNTESGNTHRQSDMNFRSNSIMDESSISPMCDQSRISQQETQIGYLKQKLIQTHAKLIKQLQISKQLEDNFFSLKKKYQNLICSHQNSKSSEAYPQKTSQLETQLKVQQNQFRMKKKQWEEKEIRYINTVSQLQKKQLQLLVQSEQKQAQLGNFRSELEGKQFQWKKQSFSLNEKLASIQQQISQINEENVHLKQKITQINQENVSLSLQINKINEESENLKYQMGQMKEESTHLKLEIKQMNEQSLQLNEQLKAYKKSVQKLMSEKLQLQSKQNMMHEQIDKRNAFAQQNRQLVNKNQELKTDLQTMRNKVLSLNKHNELLSDEIQQFTNSISTYTTQLFQLQQILAKKEKQYIEKEELCQIWRKKYSDSQQNSIKNQQIIIKHQKEEKQLKNHNSQLNIALRQQKEKNAQMLSEIINIQMENKELKSKMHVLQEQKQQLQDKLFEVTPQKNTLHQKQELELQIQKLTTEYNALSTIINKKDKEISQIKNHLFETQSLVSKLSLRERQIEKKSQELDEWSKQLEIKQKNMQEQKLSKINSVKAFVNQLQDQKERSVALRKVNLQINHQNRAQTPNHIQRQNVLNHSNIKIDSSNANNSKCLSPVSPVNSKVIPKNKNSCLTPSKSLNNLNVNSLPTNNFGSFKINQMQVNLKKNHQNSIGYSQQYVYSDHQSYEDSLQANNLKSNVITSHNPQMSNEIQIQQNYTQVPILRNKSQTLNQKYITVTPLKQINNGPSVRKPTKMEELKASNEEKGVLSSYKQEKQNYMRLLEQIGELELQSYNLGQEKKCILDQLERIQNTRVKTKDIIGKRRQLELKLLGNEKKNNEVKEKLRGIRGKVV